MSHRRPGKAHMSDESPPPSPGFPGGPYGYPGGAPGGYPGPYPPYGPGYGMPWPGWPPQAPRNKLGTAAMVLGIVGTAVGLSVIGSLLGVPLGLLALVFGFLGRRRARRGGATNGGQALAGMILGGVAVVVSVAMLVVLVVRVDHDRLARGPKVALTSSRGARNDPLESGMTATYADGTWVTVSSPRPFTPPAGAHGHRAGASAYAIDVTVDETGTSALDLSAYGWQAQAVRVGGGAKDLTLISAGTGVLARDLPRELGSGHKATVVFAFDVPDGPYSLLFGFRPAARFAGADWKLYPGA